MNQISALDADAILGKLLLERIPVRASFKSSSGAEAVIVSAQHLSMQPRNWRSSNPKARRIDGIPD
jgi:hypothetical protein